MIREEIMSMAPGPEMGRMVAEKVMGWTLVTTEGCTSHKSWKSQHGKIKYSEFLFNPSTDIATAWEVLEKFPIVNLSRIEIFEGHIHHAVEIFADENANEPVRVEAVTAPEAICKAALIATLEGGEHR